MREEKEPLYTERHRIQKTGEQQSRVADRERDESSEKESKVWRGRHTDGERLNKRSM